jgi:hypothetical protein
MRKRPYMGDARRVVVRELPKALADVIKRLARG